MTHEEERLAWDRYAAAGHNFAAEKNAAYADALLAERRKRFGDPQLPRVKDEEEPTRVVQLTPEGEYP
jgi:hypothetical protein